MAARNEITGDLIKSKVSDSEKYKKGFDEIDWSVKLEDAEVGTNKPVEQSALCEICGKSLAGTKECAWTGCPLNWDEKRIDVIGSNGPTGEHYEEVK